MRFCKLTVEIGINSTTSHLTKLVKIETGEPVGFGMALLRQICFTVTLGIGYLWPQ